jgi:hypothetical protein
LTHILGRRWGFRWAFCSLAGATALFLIVVNSSLSHLDARRSVKELALAMKPLLRPEDEIVSYHAYYRDLPVYVGRRITVVNWRGNQFPEGTEDASGWIIDDPTFWKRWKTEQPIYMVTPKETYNRLLASPGRKLYLIAQTKYDVLLSNTATLLVSRGEAPQ